MSGRLEVKIVAALAVLSLLPLAASFLLLDRVMAASESVAAGEAERRAQAVEIARAAFAELFRAEKADLRARGAQLAATAPPDLRDRATVERFLRAALDRDPALKSARLGDVELTAANPLPDEEWRALRVEERPLELTYVVPRKPFRDFAALDALQSGERALPILHQRLGGVFRVLFLVGLALVIASAAGFGMLLARRVTTRLQALARAAARVGAGDLAARVEPRGSDEVADLARAFNAMVGELEASRERIGYLQKIAAWQEIARRLAHEIKNPLTPIQLAVQQLKTSYPEAGGDPRYRTILDEASAIVVEEIGGLRRLVEEFSSFAKLPRAELKNEDAAALVDDLLRSYSHFGDRVTLAAAEGLRVRVDKLLLRRALVNLVENALQAGAGRVWITLERRGELAALVVADDGPGVPPALGVQIFDPYITTKEHGTGLGLAIVKKIVLEHGGTVTLDDRDGGGARFTILLPVA